MSTPPKTERMVPHSVEAEEAVLGAILIDPDALHDVTGFLKADDFFIVKNGWIFEAMQALSQRDEAIDYLTLTDELRRTNRLDEIGGAAYITYLLNHTPTSMYTTTYGHIVERMAIRRRLLTAASDIAELAYKEDVDTAVVVNRAESALFAVTGNGQRGDMQSMSEVSIKVLDSIDRAMDSDIHGVPTGFNDLDDLLGGLQKSDLVIVAGRPGMGKTSWMITVALNAIAKRRAAGQRCNVMLASLEMSDVQIGQRFASQLSGVSTKTMRTGALSQDEYGAMINAVVKMDAMPIHIDDTPGISPWELTAKAARLHSRIGLDLIMVDYLQLMTVFDDERRLRRKEAENRTQEVSLISQALKGLARKLDVPVIAAAQLSRAVEQRADKRPVLSDLRDSGSIEQDSDIVMFLYRDDYYNPNTTTPNQADVIVAKHRNGPTGTVPLYFRPELAQFANLRRVALDLAAYTPGGRAAEA